MKHNLENLIKKVNSAKEELPYFFNNPEMNHFIYFNTNIGEDLYVCANSLDEVKDWIFFSKNPVLNKNAQKSSLTYFCPENNNILRLEDIGVFEINGTNLACFIRDYYTSLNMDNTKVKRELQIVFPYEDMFNDAKIRDGAVPIIKTLVLDLPVWTGHYKQELITSKRIKQYNYLAFHPKENGFFEVVLQNDLGEKGIGIVFNNPYDEETLQMRIYNQEVAEYLNVIKQNMFNPVLRQNKFDPEYFLFEYREYGYDATKRINGFSHYYIKTLQQKELKPVMVLNT